MKDETALRPLVIGVCGAGTGAERWARALRGVDGVEVARLGAVTEQDLLEALSRPEIEAIAFTGDTPDLGGSIKRTLLSGRHVLAVDPPALSASQLSALGDLARRRRRTLLFDTGLLEDERIDFVRKMTVGPHALWRPRYLRSLRTGAHEGRSLDDLAIADITCVLRLAGETPVSVSAVAPRLDDETGASDVVMAMLTFPGGPAARIDVSLVEPEMRYEVVLACQGRTLVLDGYNLRAPMQIQASARHRGPQQGSWGETVSEHPAHEAAERVPRVAAAFSAAVRSRDTSTSNAHQIAEAATVWEAARESIQRGGELNQIGEQAGTPDERPALQVIRGGGRGGSRSVASLRLVSSRPSRDSDATPLSSA